MHTPQGAQLLRNFVRKIAQCRGDWTMRAFKDEAIEKIRKQVGKGRVICGLSGGVDSAVAAVLIHEAIGDQLTCVFVDHGLLRLNEGKTVVDLFRGHYNIPLVHVDASETVPRRARRHQRPGSTSARPSAGCSSTCSRPRRRRSAAPEFLAQGTLYPDVIESVSFTGGPSVTIKSHHNVGGLPARMNMKLVEPLARVVQGRGAAARPRARPARGVRRPPSVPGAGPRDPLPRRDHARRSSISSASPTTSTSTKSARPASTTRSGRPSP